jgi:predicted dehydrogenase
MLNLEAGSGSGAADPMAIGYERHRRQIVDMIEAIREGRPPMIEGAEARKSVEIILAIYRSAAEGRPVALPLVEG